jgi:hypothetical protein
MPWYFQEVHLSIPQCCEVEFSTISIGRNSRCESHGSGAKIDLSGPNEHGCGDNRLHTNSVILDIWKEAVIDSNAHEVIKHIDAACGPQRIPWFPTRSQLPLLRHCNQVKQIPHNDDIPGSAPASYTLSRGKKKNNKIYWIPNILLDVLIAPYGKAMCTLWTRLKVPTRQKEASCMQLGVVDQHCPN